MRKNAFFAVFFLFSLCAVAQTINEEKYKNNQTYTYSELISAYQKLEKSSTLGRLEIVGTTDSGLPMYLFIINKKAKSTKILALQKFSNLKFLVMNGIHPGESCGVDASLHWAEYLLKNPEEIGDATILIIPMYNVGGSLNRSCCTRANQDGPDSQGFRGNSQNYDLNRDFTKCDAHNTATFQTIMRDWDPDIFVDTHSTNGADYQYSMTFIPYNSEKWPAPLAELSDAWIKNIMDEVGKTYKSQFYVNIYGKSPEAGFATFDATSIYSGGFVGLNRTLNFTAEAHMLKPYPERVMATYLTLQTTLTESNKQTKSIKIVRQKALEADLKRTTYATQWQIDSTKILTLDFSGFELEYKPSAVTGQQRMYYNRNKPVQFNANYYPTLKAVETVNIENHRNILLHAGNTKILMALQNMGIVYQVLTKDTAVAISVQKVAEIQYAKQPYEGHFAHVSFTLNQEKTTEQFRSGDIVIPLRQKNINYLLEVFLPQTPGSFFRWNYFDAFLQQKEWFSSYVFEDIAATFLSENPEVARQFEALKKDDIKFANDAFAQIYWVYRQTPYYEKEHNRIPVFWAE